MKPPSIHELLSRRQLAKALILAGYRVAKVEGHSHDGNLAILYVEVPRKQAPKLIHDAGVIDETCFCVINDVRTAGFAAPHVNLNLREYRDEATLIRAAGGASQPYEDCTSSR